MGIFKNTKTQTIGEEIANSISHGVGAGLSVVGLVLLVIKACHSSSAIGIVSAAIYGSSLVLLYLSSCIYHALARTRANKVFRVLDHCTIFFLILGSYTPIALWLIQGVMGWVIFSINLTCTILGIVFNSINLEKWHKQSVLLYVIMGWIIVISLKPIIALGVPALMLLVMGGVMYTAGIIFYAMPKIRYFHFIWHLFVIAGSVLQYMAIYHYVY